jgi:hypothetical protein
MSPDFDFTRWERIGEQLLATDPPKFHALIRAMEDLVRAYSEVDRARGRLFALFTVEPEGGAHAAE